MRYPLKLEFYQSLRNARRLRRGQVLRRLLLRFPVSAGATRAFYAARFSPYLWRRVLNRRATRHFLTTATQLDSEQGLLVSQLQADGIAISTAWALVETPTFDALRAQAAQLLEAPHVVNQITMAKSTASKNYLIREQPVFDFGSPVVQLVIHPKVVQLVNAYLGLSCRLKSFELWETLPVPENAPIVASQRWHRDYDDRSLVKLFLYLEDVDPGMGPFSFYRGTQPGGPRAALFPSRPPVGAYPPAEAVERALPPSSRCTCVGPAGTLILCDTTGIHSGGRSTTQRRRLLTATYATDAAIEPDLYPRPRRGHEPSGLSPAVRYALRM